MNGICLALTKLEYPDSAATGTDRSTKVVGGLGVAPSAGHFISTSNNKTGN